MLNHSIALSTNLNPSQVSMFVHTINHKMLTGLIPETTSGQLFSI